jgi:hypothetical protein
MKSLQSLLFILLFLISFNLYAHDSQDKKIKVLEQRIKKLESMLEKSKKGIKVKNMKNKKMKRVLGNPDQPNKELSNLTPEQQAEIELIIKKYKENQKKSQEALEELMKEP